MGATMGPSEFSSRRAAFKQRDDTDDLAGMFPSMREFRE